MNDAKVIALIPARAGSKRVKNKNIRLLGDHPLIAYTISAAKRSGVFSDIHVSTDLEHIAEIAKYYGAEAPFLRPAEMAGDKSPDIEWLDYTVRRLSDEGLEFDAFSLLRPTSPFRQAETIQRAWEAFRERRDVDSLRAVELCEQHPGKMWVLKDDLIEPLLKDGPKDPPWHSTPYQALPVTYIQNASLEIAWKTVVTEKHSIAGDTLMPLITDEMEGYDINNPKDWWYAEHLIEKGEANLPQVDQDPYPDL